MEALIRVPRPPGWLQELAPWVGLTLVWAWFTAPLWRTADRLFVGRLATDGVVTPWFTTTVARRLAEDQSLDVLWGFDWPQPWERAREFPSIADAVMLAPIVWTMGWPAWWNVAVSAAAGINALGAALLVRALGAGPLGVLAAGVLGLLSRPVWADVIMARLNVAFPGLVMLSLGALVFCFRAPGRHLWVRLVAAVVAAAAGMQAALVYPPFLALFAPAGAVLVLGAWARGSWGGGWRAWLGGLVLAGLSVGAAVALAWPELMEIAANPGRPPDCSAHDCMDRYHSVSLDHLALTGPIARDGLTLSGLHAVGWLALPAVLLARRKVEALGLALLALLLGFLGLGPCPMLAGDTPWENDNVEALVLALDPVWCWGGWLHDWGRFASAAGMLLALAAGLGIDGIARRGWPGAVIAAALLLGGGGWVAGDLWTEVLAEGRWHRPDVPETARFLLDHPGTGAVAELPYDRSVQFLSHLSAPERPRRNPLQGHPHGPPRYEALAWLDAVAMGREASVAPPTREQLARTGLEYVFHDPDRCFGPVPHTACGSWATGQLEAVLGEPELIGGGVRVWHLD